MEADDSIEPLSNHPRTGFRGCDGGKRQEAMKTKDGIEQVYIERESQGGGQRQT